MRTHVCRQCWYTSRVSGESTGQIRSWILRLRRVLECLRQAVPRRRDERVHGGSVAPGRLLRSKPQFGGIHRLRDVSILSLSLSRTRAYSSCSLPLLSFGPQLLRHFLRIVQCGRCVFSVSSTTVGRVKGQRHKSSKKPEAIMTGFKGPPMVPSPVLRVKVENARLVGSGQLVASTLSQQPGYYISAQLCLAASETPVFLKSTLAWQRSLKGKADTQRAACSSQPRMDDAGFRVTTCLESIDTTTQAIAHSVPWRARGNNKKNERNATRS